MRHVGLPILCLFAVICFSNTPFHLHASEPDASVPENTASPTPFHAKITSPPKETAERLGLDARYTKHVDVHGFSIVGFEQVNDFAMIEAAYLIDTMLQNRPDILKALVDNRIRLVVMAYDQMTTDVPEHSKLKPKEYWDRRARGLGPSHPDSIVSCGEENLLNYPGDPYSTENILIHEFAHAIHSMGLKSIDQDFQKRLDAIYKNAKEKELWKDTYAGSNSGELFAEAVQTWFDTNRQNDPSHNHVNTREELIEYDPELADLVQETFGDIDWRYTPPRDRSKPGHLEGLDRTSLPRFRWPAEVEKVDIEN